MQHKYNQNQNVLKICYRRNYETECIGYCLSTNTNKIIMKTYSIQFKDRRDKNVVSLAMLVKSYAFFSPSSLKSSSASIIIFLAHLIIVDLKTDIASLSIPVIFPETFTYLRVP